MSLVCLVRWCRSTSERSYSGDLQKHDDRDDGDGDGDNDDDNNDDENSGKANMIVSSQ